MHALARGRPVSRAAGALGPRRGWRCRRPRTLAPCALAPPGGSGSVVGGVGGVRGDVGPHPSASQVPPLPTRWLSVWDVADLAALLGTVGCSALAVATKNAAAAAPAVALPLVWLLTARQRALMQQAHAAAMAEQLRALAGETAQLRAALAQAQAQQSGGKADAGATERLAALQAAQEAQLAKMGSLQDRLANASAQVQTAGVEAAAATQKLSKQGDVLRAQLQRDAAAALNDSVDGRAQAVEQAAAILARVQALEAAVREATEAQQKQAGAVIRAVEAMGASGAEAGVGTAEVGKAAAATEAAAAAAMTAAAEISAASQTLRSSVDDMYLRNEEGVDAMATVADRVETAVIQLAEVSEGTTQRQQELQEQALEAADAAEAELRETLDDLAARIDEVSRSQREDAYTQAQQSGIGLAGPSTPPLGIVSDAYQQAIDDTVGLGGGSASEVTDAAEGGAVAFQEWLDADKSTPSASAQDAVAAPAGDARNMRGLDQDLAAMRAVLNAADKYVDEDTKYTDEFTDDDYEAGDFYENEEAEQQASGGSSGESQQPDERYEVVEDWEGLSEASPSDVKPVAETEIELLDDGGYSDGSWQDDSGSNEGVLAAESSVEMLDEDDLGTEPAADESKTKGLDERTTLVEPAEYTGVVAEETQAEEVPAEELELEEYEVTAAEEEQDTPIVEQFPPQPELAVAASVPEADAASSPAVSADVDELVSLATEVQLAAEDFAEDGSAEGVEEAIAALEEAREYLEEACELDPARSSPYESLGCVGVQMARLYMQEAALLAEEDDEVSADESAADAKAELLAAASDFREALVRDGRSEQALFNWGLSLRLRAEIASNQGEVAAASQLFAAAAEKFDAVLSLSPESESALLNLAQSLLRRVEDGVRGGEFGDDEGGAEAAAALLDEAIEVCEQSLDLDPSSDEANEVLRQAKEGLRALGFEA